MADAYLVDTGVFLRWYVDQNGYEHAREIQRDFLDGAVQLETVEFARVEVAEVLRKKGLLTGRLDKATFLAAARIIDDLGVLVHPTDPGRLERAVDVSVRLSLRLFERAIRPNRAGARNHFADHRCQTVPCRQRSGWHRVAPWSHSRLRGCSPP